MPIEFNYKKGFSLTELLVAMLVTSLVATAVLSLYTSASRNFDQVIQSGKLQNTAEILFSTIENDLARGGFVHPLRGHVMNDGTITNNCKDDISKEDAVKILFSGAGVSACFDIPNYEETLVYRYKVTYKKGDGETNTPNENTLYKKVIRTDDCGDTDITNTADVNYEELAHNWQPVADGMGSILFSFPTIGSTQKNDLLNVDINMVSSTENAYLNFKKEVFLRNKLLASNSTNCKGYCPNSKSTFRNYNISANADYYDTTDAANVIPRARIVIDQANYNPDQDRMDWSATKATEYGLAVVWNDTLGILEIDGAVAIGADDMQDFIRTVRYVNMENTILDRTRTNANPDRRITLVLGFADLCAPNYDLLGRNDGNDTFHFYCYIENIADGRNNGYLWWGQAQLRAEAQIYYNLKGYLATIVNQNEQQYIAAKVKDNQNKVPAAWLGGSDARQEDQWLWMGGPEIGEPIVDFTTIDEDGISVDVWRPNEPNDCCHNRLNNIIDDVDWEDGEHRPMLSNLPGANVDPFGIKFIDRVNDNDLNVTLNTHHRGEHYLQLTYDKPEARWNDLTIYGSTGRGTYSTAGYILEFSTNWTGDIATCPTTPPVGAVTDEQKYSCVNFFKEFEITMDDYTYLDNKMLDYCDIDPDSNGITP